MVTSGKYDLQLSFSLPYNVTQVNYPTSSSYQELIDSEGVTP